MRFELSDEVRMSIREKELTRRINRLRYTLDAIAEQNKCGLTQAISIYKDRYAKAGKRLSDETLMDLDLILEEAAKTA